MLSRKWMSSELMSYEDWLSYKNSIIKLSPKICGFDTETTGLHLTLDKPFLVQFGFAHPEKLKGYTFLIDTRVTSNWKSILKDWFEIAAKADVNIGANIKFDLHMLHNIGIDLRDDNLADLQFYIRYGTDAVHTSEGGAPLALKDFTARYVDISAKYHEKLLDNLKSDQVKLYNGKLKNRLAVLGAPPPPFKQKSFTLAVIHELFKDPLFDYTDLPENIRKVYMEWKEQDLPEYLRETVQATVVKDMIRYDTLDSSILYKYAHLDIVYTIEDYEKMLPIVQARNNMAAVELENSLILPLYDMECTGFLADKKYLEESRIRTKEYTLKCRSEFIELAGEQVAIGQKEKIKNILNNKFGLNVSGTDSSELDQVKSKLIRDNGNEDAIRFIDLLGKLRTLEKWYSTYIIRFQKELKHCDRLYTQINSVGAVSGRVTSDFQQFPKVAITDDDGNELFHPRRLVLVPPNCKGLLYLDYSQIELRFQAMYTILVGHPDMNMCRAYMPYKCHKEDGTKFDFHNINHIKDWKADWYTDESNEKWIPTDIHGATTLAAFEGLTRDDPDFHKLRYVGKRVDFAKNYGASLPKIIQMFPEYSLEQCKRIDSAYYIAFPGVKEYHQYCFNRAQGYAYTCNLFGVRYYGVNGHKLRNILVQGSAAHFLKYRIRAIWEFLQENGYKSRLQMQIHDELVFELSSEDPPLAKKLKAIMEDWDDALVPVVAEGEITNTTWADKRELEL